MNKLKISIEKQIIKRSSLSPFSAILFEYLTGGLFAKKIKQEEEKP